MPCVSRSGWSRCAPSCMQPGGRVRATCDAPWRHVSKRRPAGIRSNGPPSRQQHRVFKALLQNFPPRGSTLTVGKCAALPALNRTRCCLQTSFRNFGPALHETRCHESGVLFFAIFLAPCLLEVGRFGIRTQSWDLDDIGDRGSHLREAAVLGGGVRGLHKSASSRSFAPIAPMLVQAWSSLWTAPPELWAAPQ